MDALPLVVNRQQLELMHENVGQAIDQLQDRNQSGQFSTSSDQNLLTYGTTNYDEAHTLVKAIDDELQTCLASWNEAPDATRPVQIALNSFQIGVLRHSLKQGMGDRTNGNGETQHLYEDLLSQLPEDSPQENAD